MKKSTLSAFAITFSLSGNSIFTGAFSPSPTKKLPPSNSQKTDKTSLPYASDFDHCQAIGICGYLPTELLQSEIEAAQEKIEAFAHGFALSRLKETKKSRTNGRRRQNHLYEKYGYKHPCTLR